MLEHYWLGFEKGKIKGKEEALVFLLQKKFKVFPKCYEKRVSEGDPILLQHWMDRLLDSKTIENIFQ